MGYAALQIAQTGGSRPADQKASLIVVAGLPLGKFILVAGIVAIASYSVWGFFRAIYDPLRRGRDPQGIATRLGFAWSGPSYLILAFFAFGLATNGSTGSQAAEQFLFHEEHGEILRGGVGAVGSRGVMCWNRLQIFNHPFDPRDHHEHTSFPAGPGPGVCHHRPIPRRPSAPAEEARRRRRCPSSRSSAARW